MKKKYKTAASQGTRSKKKFQQDSGLWEIWSSHYSYTNKATESPVERRTQRQYQLGLRLQSLTKSKTILIEQDKSNCNKNRT